MLYRYRGWNAILADFFATLGPRSNGTFRAELVDVLVGEQVVAAFQHATGQRNGKRLDVTACQVMSFRDGRIAEVPWLLLGPVPARRVLVLSLPTVHNGFACSRWRGHCSP
jgi:hypothetical protein